MGRGVRGGRGGAEPQMLSFNFFLGLASLFPVKTKSRGGAQVSNSLCNGKDFLMR